VVKSLRRKKKNGVESEELPKDVQFKMGPLKKVSRVVQKAAHYAVCDDNSEKLQLAKVRDILRATMVFPPAAWGGDNIGSEFIDAIDKHFDGAVVQVKNRFIETRYPNLKPLEYTRLPADLMKHIEWIFKRALYGRDTFYRDMQLLILIDNNKFPNGQGMTHTILELQLATSWMYGAKTFKGTGMSGHDMYKTVRAVMEYAEFLYRQKYWKNRSPSQQVKLQDAARYYEATPERWSQFSASVTTMYGLYRRRDVRRLGLQLDKAIDNSKWYKDRA
jgi:hypothetical protein